MSADRSASPASRSFTIHPSPYGSLFTSAGSPSSRGFTSTISPATGMYSSLTALTASIVPNVSCAPKLVPGLGRSR